MMRHCYTILCISALLLLAACGGRYERMRQQLDSLQALNLADSLLTDDSLALALTQYFDSHGTPNDRMLAHYLLARTYADMGQAPQALDEFHTAAECADTTSADCDYRILSRVYAQLGRLFSSQMLANKQLENTKLAIHYACLASDTMQQIASMALLGEAYEMTEELDSALFCFKKAYQNYLSIGLNDYGAALQCSMANIYLQQKNRDAVKNCLEDFEHNSGFFHDGNIEKGREVYYYVKGSYYLTTAQFDSAEYYFRKELVQAADVENQIAANKGLFQLYTISFQRDSLVKYSRQTDSLASTVHNEIEMELMLQMQALYDYSEMEKKSIHERQKAKDAQNMAIILLLTCIIVLLISVILYRKVKKKLWRYTLEQHLQRSKVVERLKKKAKHSPPEKADNCDMNELQSLVLSEIPSFFNSLHSNDYRLTRFEEEVCLLLRVHMSPSEIYKLLGCSSGYITNIRIRLLKRVFGQEGSGDDFDKIIKDIV